MVEYWAPGEEVVFRHVEDGVLRYAAPSRVIEDSEERSVLDLPRFSVVYTMNGERLVPCQWEASVLRIIERGRWYSLLFFWDVESSRPLHWYVNLEEPARRY